MALPPRDCAILGKLLSFFVLQSSQYEGDRGTYLVGWVQNTYWHTATPSKCELAVTVMITITFSGWEVKPTKDFHFQVIYLYIFVYNICYLYNHIPVRFKKILKGTI